MALLKVGSAVTMRAVLVVAVRQCPQERIQRNHVRSSQSLVCAATPLQRRSVSTQGKHADEPKLLFESFIKNPDLRHFHFENKDLSELDQKFWDAFYAFLKDFPMREFTINFEGNKIPVFGLVGLKNQIYLSEIGVWRREIEKPDGKNVGVFFEPFMRAELNDGSIIRTPLK
jgi:hypothetical protein